MDHSWLATSVSLGVGNFNKKSQPKSRSGKVEVKGFPLFHFLLLLFLLNPNHNSEASSILLQFTYNFFYMKRVFLFLSSLKSNVTILILMFLCVEQKSESVKILLMKVMFVRLHFLGKLYILFSASFYECRLQVYWFILLFSANIVCF